MGCCGKSTIEEPTRDVNPTPTFKPPRRMMMETEPLLPPVSIKPKDPPVSIKPKDPPVSIKPKDPPVFLPEDPTPIRKDKAPVIEELVPLPRVKIEPAAVRTLNVSLQSVGQIETDTSNAPLPPVYYVIVGRGPAAVINHTTLLQSTFGKDRMDKAPRAGKIPVLHIGFRNPWSWYFAHGMGQPNYLLGLPGFHPANQPGSEGNNEMKDEGLKSVVFGGCVDREMAWCLDQERARWSETPLEPPKWESANWPEMNGCVMWIQKKGEGPPEFGKVFDNEIGGPAMKTALLKALAVTYPAFAEGIAPYRLAVFRPAPDNHIKIDLLYAQFIDLCTGSGRPRQDRKDPVFASARLEPWRDPSTWTTAALRKIAVATEAIRQEFTWPKDQRICIANGGAIGLNAAERARDETGWTDWFHNASLLGAPPTFANPRNFSFLRAKTENRPRRPSEGDPITDDDLIAADSRTRMGSFAQVNVATATCDITLGVGIPRGMTDAPIDQAPTRIRDYYHKSVDGVRGLTREGSWDVSEQYKTEYLKARGEKLPTGSYDYLILHNGLDTNDLGQARKLFTEPVVPKSEDALRGMTSLETGDGVIRLLGAAAQMSVVEFAKNSAVVQMGEYRKTLPISAVPDGFILSGINIAAANQFVAAGKPANNANTMTLAEMERALEVNDLDKKLAAPILLARNASNGFSSLENMITKAKLEAPDRIKLAQALKFSY